MRQIYTIGYSGFEITDFVEVLMKYKVSCVVDVRSNPNSKNYIDYNKDFLKVILSQNHIYYRNYDKEFGARQTDAQYYTDGYLDFEKFVNSPDFLNGIKKIENGMEQNYTFALMCAEKDPATCHRNIMVAQEFYRKGYKICNILSDGTIETQDSIEERLINSYFPERNQFSLFEDNLSREEMVKQAYRLRNKEIGFRLNDAKGD